MAIYAKGGVASRRKSKVDIGDGSGPGGGGLGSAQYWLGMVSPLDVPAWLEAVAPLEIKRRQ